MSSAHRVGHRTRWLLLVGAALTALAAFALFQSGQANREASATKLALLRAEKFLSAGDLDRTRTELLAAKRSLRRVNSELRDMGPLLPVARVLPVVRWQVEAVEKFRTAGTLLSDAGLRLTDAAQRVQATSRGSDPLSGLLEALRGIDESLAGGAESVRAARKALKGLGGKLLLGPVDGTRDDLMERLPRYERKVASAAKGIDALRRFVGGEGQRRYLFLSQNPDEIRPTGGFIGTYGVLTASPEALSLERFEPIQRFSERHPGAVVPGGETTSPFRFASPPLPQSMANVNNVADFGAAGKRAADLWNATGEPPVDGVVSFSPAFLARLLGVLGPVTVPEYGETVDQGNLIERFDFYTQRVLLDPDAEITRKAFVASLAEVVLQRLLDAPSSQWQALAKAMGAGFTAREAMVWSADPQVASALADHGWDGVLPRVDGDFFYNAEFSYLAKMNRGLRRVFDHHVELRRDGSARITTTMTVTNGRERNLLNVGSLSYITVYGPEGAVLDPASDPPASTEPPLAGHPAAGWFLDAPPLGKATLEVVWDADAIARKAKGGREYSLRWLRVPDHSGDVLNLRVDLPKGWRWKGPPPPSTIELDQDVDGTWAIRTDGDV